MAGARAQHQGDHLLRDVKKAREIDRDHRGEIQAADDWPASGENDHCLSGL